MVEKIIIAGSGGQGIMLIGKILATSAMQEAKYVTWLPSYGAEVRGGTSHCMVVISSEQIGSPYIKDTDSLIVLNSASLKKFKNRLKKGLLVINSSLVPKYTNQDVKILQHPFTDMALELGNIKVANMIALGCLLKHKHIVDLKSVVRAISNIAPAEKKGLIEINKKALELGACLK